MNKIKHVLERTEVRADGSEWEYGKTYDDGTYFGDWCRLIKYRSFTKRT